MESWAHRYRLSESQRLLLEGALLGLEKHELASHLRVRLRELETLEQLFRARTGRTLQGAVSEIERVAARRSSRPKMKAASDEEG